MICLNGYGNFFGHNVNKGIFNCISCTRENTRIITKYIVLSAINQSSPNSNQSSIVSRLMTMNHESLVSRR